MKRNQASVTRRDASGGTDPPFWPVFPGKGSFDHLRVSQSPRSGGRSPRSPWSGRERGAARVCPPYPQFPVRAALNTLPPTPRPPTPQQLLSEERPVLLPGSGGLRGVVTLGALRSPPALGAGVAAAPCRHWTGCDSPGRRPPFYQRLPYLPGVFQTAPPTHFV